MITYQTPAYERAHKLEIHSVDVDSKNFILWEGYLSSDKNLFVVCYFDCVFEYTEWLQRTDIYHVGNVQNVEHSEFAKAYNKYASVNY
jgi:hypothetical protein